MGEHLVGRVIAARAALHAACMGDDEGWELSGLQTLQDTGWTLTELAELGSLVIGYVGLSREDMISIFIFMRFYFGRIFVDSLFR
jgi:hypothetical protein